MNYTESFSITSQIRMFLRIVPDNFFHINITGNLLYNTINQDVIAVLKKVKYALCPMPYDRGYISFPVASE